MLLNIYIKSRFFALKEIDICNFADEANPYVCNSSLKSLFEKLKHNFELAFAMFKMNYMKLNTDSCHLLASANKNEYMWAKYDQNIVWENNKIIIWNFLELQ